MNKLCGCILTIQDYDISGNCKNQYKLFHSISVCLQFSRVTLESKDINKKWLELPKWKWKPRMRVFRSFGPPIKSSTAIQPKHTSRRLPLFACCSISVCLLLLGQNMYIKCISVTYVTVNPIEVGYFILSDQFFRRLITLVFDGHSYRCCCYYHDLTTNWSSELCANCDRMQSAESFVFSEYMQEVQWVNTNPSSQSSEICNNTSECTLWINCIADYPPALDLLTYYLIRAIFICYCVSQALSF